MLRNSNSTSVPQLVHRNYNVTKAHSSKVNLLPSITPTHSNLFNSRSKSPQYTTSSRDSRFTATSTKQSLYSPIIIESETGQFFHMKSSIQESPIKTASPKLGTHRNQGHVNKIKIVAELKKKHNRKMKTRIRSPLTINSPSNAYPDDVGKAPFTASAAISGVFGFMENRDSITKSPENRHITSVQSTIDTYSQSKVICPLTARHNNIMKEQLNSLSTYFKDRGDSINKSLLVARANFAKEEDFIKLNKKIRGILSKEEAIKNLEEKTSTTLDLGENEFSYFKFNVENRPTPLTIHIKKYRGKVNMYSSRQARPNKNSCAESIAVKSGMFRLFGGGRKNKFSFEILYVSFHALTDSKIQIQYLFGKDSFPKKITKVIQQSNEKMIEKPPTEHNFWMEKLKAIEENKTAEREFKLYIRQIRMDRRDRMFDLAKNKNIILKNMNVVEQYREFLASRQNKKDKYQQRLMEAEIKREKLLQYNIIRKTLMMYKWNIRKHQSQLLQELKFKKNENRRFVQKWILIISAFHFMKHLKAKFKKRKEEKIRQFEEIAASSLIAKSYRKTMAIRGENPTDRILVNCRHTFTMTFAQLKETASDRAKETAHKDNVKRKFLHFFQIMTKIANRIKRNLANKEKRKEELVKFWNKTLESMKAQKNKRGRGRNFRVKEEAMETFIYIYMLACKFAYNNAFKMWRELLKSKEYSVKKAAEFAEFWKFKKEDKKEEENLPATEINVQSLEQLDLGILRKKHRNPRNKVQVAPKQKKKAQDDPNDSQKNPLYILNEVAITAIPPAQIYMPTERLMQEIIEIASTYKDPELIVLKEKYLIQKKQESAAKKELEQKEKASTLKKNTIELISLHE